MSFLPGWQAWYSRLEIRIVWLQVSEALSPVAGSDRASERSCTCGNSDAAAPAGGDLPPGGRVQGKTNRCGLGWLRIRIKLLMIEASLADGRSLVDSKSPWEAWESWLFTPRDSSKCGPCRNWFPTLLGITPSEVSGGARAAANADTECSEWHLSLPFQCDCVQEM